MNTTKRFHAELPKSHRGILLSRAGITLVELLAVLAIGIVLAALLFPAISNARRASLGAQCITNLKNIGVAMHLYAGDNNGWLPPANFSGADGKGVGKQWDAVIMPYLNFFRDVDGDFSRTADLFSVFYCPAAKPFPNLPRIRSLSYGYNWHVANNEENSRKLSAIQSPARLPLAADLEQEEGLNQGHVTFAGVNNRIWIGAGASRAKAIPYSRHGVKANILFADGGVSARSPVGKLPNQSYAAYYPRGITWFNGSVVTPD